MIVELSVGIVTIGVIIYALRRLRQRRARDDVLRYIEGAKKEADRHGEKKGAGTDE